MDIISASATRKIKKCASGHYFTTARCYICDRKPLEEYPYRPGDCIACGGALCGDQAYCCNSSVPLTEADFGDHWT